MEEFWIYLDLQLQNRWCTTPLLIQTTSALLMCIIVISVFSSMSESNRQTKKGELYRKLVQSVQQKIDRENEETFLPQQQNVKLGQASQNSVNNSGDQDLKSSLTSSIATLEKEIESMKTENFDLQKDAQETENKWKELEIEIREAETKLASVQQDGGTLDVGKNNLESNIKNLEVEIKTSEKSVRVKKNEIVQANNKQKKAGKEVNDLKVNIEAEKRRVSSLEKQVLDEGKKVEDFEKLVGVKEKLIEDKNAQIQKHQHNFEALKNAYNRINVENGDSDEDDFSKSDKLSQIIDCGNVKEELMQNKEKLMLMESTKSKDTARLQVAAEKITLLSGKLEKAEAEVAKVEDELQMLKTKARVAKEFYAEMDTKAQIEVGRKKQLNEMNKISKEEMTIRENEVEASLLDYRKMNRELFQKLEKAEREKRQEIENFEKQSHINWMAQKDMDREWAAAVQESHDMQTRIEQKSKEMIEVRNASGLGAPEDSDSSSDDSEFDGPAPTPPTMPAMMPMFMGMPHMGQPPMAPSPGFNYPTNSYSPFPGQNIPPSNMLNMQQNMHPNVYSNMQPNIHQNVHQNRPPSMPTMPQQYMNPGLNSNMGQNINPNLNPNMQIVHPNMHQNMNPNIQQPHLNVQQNRPPSMTMMAATHPQQYYNGFQATSTPPLQQSQINTSQVKQSNE